MVNPRGQKKPAPLQVREAVLEALRQRGPLRFKELFPLVSAQLEIDAFRPVDRALQVLRKAKLIRRSRTDPMRWELTW